MIRFVHHACTSVPVGLALVGAGIGHVYAGRQYLESTSNVDVPCRRKQLPHFRYAVRDGKSLKIVTVKDSQGDCVR